VHLLCFSVYFLRFFLIGSNLVQLHTKLEIIKRERRCEDGLDLCGHVGLPVALAMITGAYNGNARGPRTLVEGVDDAV
jgi:hypothetical protein